MEIFRRRHADGNNDKTSKRDASAADHVDVSLNGTTSMSSSTLMDIAQRHFREMSADGSVETEHQESAAGK